MSALQQALLASYKNISTLLNGLLAYYKFESNSNDTVWSLNGTDTSITYWTWKIWNGAIWNWSNSKISTASTTLFSWNDISISFWIKPWASQSEVVKTILDYNHWPWNGWVIQSENANSTGRYYFTWWNGSAFQGAGAGNWVVLTPDVWQHIVYTKIGTVTKWYVNWTETWSFTWSWTLVSASYPLTILAWQGVNRSFNGTMDELWIWNRWLTPAEVTQLYNSWNGISHPF